MLKSVSVKVLWLEVSCAPTTTCVRSCQHTGRTAARRPPFQYRSCLNHAALRGPSPGTQVTVPPSRRTIRYTPVGCPRVPVTSNCTRLPKTQSSKMLQTLFSSKTKYCRPMKADGVRVPAYAMWYSTSRVRRGTSTGRSSTRKYSAKRYRLASNE